VTLPALLPNLRQTGPDSWTYGFPAPAGHVETWHPVRYVGRDQVCVGCWRRIPRGAPGKKSGTRGTRAFIELGTRLWRCVKCQLELAL